MFTRVVMTRPANREVLSFAQDDNSSEKTQVSFAHLGTRVLRFPRSLTPLLNFRQHFFDDIQRFR
jgi:hypothetical protein